MVGGSWDRESTEQEVAAGPTEAQSRTALKLSKSANGSLQWFHILLNIKLLFNEQQTNYFLFCIFGQIEYFFPII